MAILVLFLTLVVGYEGALQRRSPGPSQTAPSAGRPGQARASLRIVTGQQGSIVFLNNVRNGATSDKGELNLDRINAGAYSVRVRTVGYEDWRGRVVARAQGPNTLNVKQVRTSDQAVLHYQKGDALREGGNNEEAVGEYKQALKLNPRLADAAIGCARSLIASQEFEDAEAMLQKAVRSSTGVVLAEAETVLGNLRRSQQLLDESISYYKKALALAGGISPEAHIGLALALQENKRLDEAIPHFKLGLAQDMDTEPILYYLLGKALENQGKNKEAAEAYGGYLRLEPEGQYSSAVQSIIEQLKNKD